MIRAVWIEYTRDGWTYYAQAYRGPIETCNVVAQSWIDSRPDVAVSITTY